MIFFANSLNKLFQESVWRIILRKYILGFKELMPGGWESLIKVTGLLFGRFKLNTQGRPMWVWLKLNLTPRGDFCVVSVRYFLYLN